MRTSDRPTAPCNPHRPAHSSRRSAALLLALMLPASALPPGGDGLVVDVQLSGAADVAYASVLEPDGRLVFAGSAAASSQIGLARYAGGVPDATFGDNGVKLYNLSNGGEQLLALARMADGRYVGCGTSFVSGTATDFLVVRLENNGSLDTTLAGTGFVTTSFLQSGPGGSLFDQCNAVAVQGDGKIVAAGLSYQNGPPNVALVRYNTDGTLDGGFGSGGKVVINPSAAANSPSEAHALAIQPDGKIVIAGLGFGSSHNSDLLLMRFTTSGAPDTTFAGTGAVFTNVANGEDVANALVLQPDGRIVVAGFAAFVPGGRDFVVARYHADGTLDPTFGGDGIVTTRLGDFDDIAYSLALMPWGRLVAAGSTRESNTTSRLELALVAYNADGSLDGYFGDAGAPGTRRVAVSGPADANDIAYSLASDIEHTRLWAVGTGDPINNQNFLAVEFGLPDTIFRNGFEHPL